MRTQPNAFGPSEASAGRRALARDIRSYSFGLVMSVVLAVAFLVLIVHTPPGTAGDNPWLRGAHLLEPLALFFAVFGGANSANSVWRAARAPRVLLGARGTRATWGKWGVEVGEDPSAGTVGTLYLQGGANAFLTDSGSYWRVPERHWSLPAL